MRRSPPRLAFSQRHEVSGGGHVVHREGQGATAPALLGGAEEPLLDGHLACDLPGLAGGDSLAVACAMRGCGHSFEENAVESFLFYTTADSS